MSPSNAQHAEGRQQIRLMADAEVAQVYGVTRQTVWKWAKLGRIPSPVVMPGVERDRKRWRSSDIESHIAQLTNAQMEEAAS